MMTPHIRWTILYLTFILFTSKVFAFERLTLSKSPIEIHSDSVHWDQNLHEAYYKGKVILTQGSTTLYADNLRVKHTEEGNIAKVIATGNPAMIEQKQSEPSSLNHNLLKGKALTIIYLPANKCLIMENKAELIQGNNLFKGPEVAFNLNTKQVTALSIENERPTIIYQPT